MLNVNTINEINKFVIKVTDVTADWLSLRSNDIGREAILLSSSQINSLWEIVDNPYLTVAIEKNKYALLMRDVSEQLCALNHMDIDNCDNLALHTLAKIHAQFWENKELSKESALMGLPNYIQINGPYKNYYDTTQPIGRKIFRGWDEAKKLLPRRTYNWLNRPVNEIIVYWGNYPNTLLHGDYRPTNLGYSNESKKMLPIDWAASGFGPCTIDLFFYLASTSNLRDDNEKPIKLYRVYLEEMLGRRITENEWEILIEIGIVSSCYLLLWDKALSYTRNKIDWEWWLSKLEEVVNKYPGKSS
jgi:thiamine kinase-like enzyme